VRLDYPDDLRMRQQVDVVALRLTTVDEGQVLHIWVNLPYDELDGDDEDELEDDDDFGLLP
jgi:hypothetical protein